MNNHRSNNNRRRGRGNHRSQGGNQNSQSNQSNRIDSRARGNAAQLLEKFKKMAQDASLNGDRVQAEYYLQFADHYFRVVADGKARMEEQRVKRDEERAASDHGNQDGAGDNEGERNARRSPPRNEQRDEQSNEDPRFADDELGEDAAAGDESQNDSSKNPFTRRAPRSRKPAPRKRENDAPPENEAVGLDPASLPPAIGASDGGGDGEDEKPAPRKRVRRTRPAADDGGETLEKAG